VFDIPPSAADPSPSPSAEPNESAPTIARILPPK
jgi:hypothetical protein